MNVASRWAADDARNIQLYSKLVETYGTDVRALNWGSREAQHARFAVLAQVGDLQDATLLDVGCGVGDLYAWMRERGVRVSYTGIDITPSMVEVARRRFPEESFQVKNLLDARATGERAYDYVLASGLFTHRREEPSSFLVAMTTRMFAVCRRAVALNCLSTWASTREPEEYHADPLDTMRACRTLTSRIVVRHDYHPGDFTLYLYR